MRRLPALAFVVLAVATVGAFFFTQHLKVTTPLIAGQPAPFPAVIDPLEGGICGGVNHRRMSVSFYLLHRSDDVNVYIVDSSGAIVATLASGVHMQGGRNPVRRAFLWDGRQDDGRLVPDGLYYIQVALIHQGRTVEISSPAGPEPITVMTTRPRPRVTGVRPALVPQGRSGVTIAYTGNNKRSGTVVLYRTDLPGTPRPAKTFVTPWAVHQVRWDGRIREQPAPAGVYLVGLNVTNAACVTGHYPATLPPVAGTTAHSGVTVRYLAAQPPFDPVPAGARTTVYVDARHHGYAWTLWRAGAPRPVARGLSNRFALRLRPKVPGLYELALRSGTHATSVPVVVSGSAAATAHHKMLVVLPALTWAGLDPVDGDGDGLPDTLDSASAIVIARPLEHGLPPGAPGLATLLAFLSRSHLAFDLTTDVGLADGIGPAMSGHAAVLLAGDERWWPAALAAPLRAYVQRGGHVISLGIDSLRRTASVSRGSAVAPSAPSATDLLGAHLGSLTRQSAGDLISVGSDGLGIFSGTSGAISGFTSYQPVASVAPPAQLVTSAGLSAGAPSIVGFSLGQGSVVEIGLPGFAASLAGNVDAQDLLTRTWKVLGG